MSKFTKHSSSGHWKRLTLYKTACHVKPLEAIDLTKLQLSHLSLLCAVHGDGCVDEQVLKLQRLHQVGVPHQTAVRHLQNNKMTRG
jgi:hypothetical protein